MARPSQRRGQPVPERQDPNLVCDREDLGHALRWMIHTAGQRAKPSEDPPPQSEAELAAKLSVSRQQVNKYVQGRDITSLRWDEILETLRIEGPERGSWATAYDRVQYHSKKCKQRYEHRGSLSETESPDASAIPHQADFATQRDVLLPLGTVSEHKTRRRSLSVAAVLVGMAVAAAVIGTVVVVTGSAPTTSAEARPLGSGPALEPGTPCAAGGTNFSIENHHSGMVINNLDRPRMGLARSTTDISVTYRTLTASGGGCLITFHAGSGEHDGSCLEMSEVGGTELETVWRPCRDYLDQKWSSEKHWNDGQVVWERFHSGRNEKLCLQQASTGGVTTPLTVKACDNNWLQQWKVVNSRSQ